MCNLGLISGLVSVMNTTLASAALLLGAAMVATNSVFGAAAGPGFVLAALAAFISAGGTAAVIGARVHVAQECQSCANESKKLLLWLDIAATSAASFSVALFVALGTAAIPILGSIGIGAALVALAALGLCTMAIPQAIEALADCMRQANAAGRLAVLITSAFFLVSLFILGSQGMGVNGQQGGELPIGPRN